MNDFQIPTEQQPPRRSWIFPALLLIAGVLIGVILTSDLGWLPTGHAVPESALLRSQPRSPRRCSPRCPARVGRVSSMSPKS
jgi:hypothetical protein